MILNYIKIAWRKLIRSKLEGTLNIVGLSIGITASLLLFVVVQYELSYDKFQSNYGDIYRIVTEQKYPDGFDYNPGVPNPVPDALQAELLPFEKVVPVKSADNIQVNIYPNDLQQGIPEKFEVDNLFYSTPEYAELFDVKFIAGDAKSLKDPNIIFLTKSSANNFFGDWEVAMDKTLELTNGLKMTVAGVVEDMPQHSNMQFDMLASYQTVRSNPVVFDHDFGAWGDLGSDNQVYVMLSANSSLATMQILLDQFSLKHFENQGNSEKMLHLQAFEDLHFDQRYGALSGSMIRMSTVNTLMVIGVFILMMASINFVNLSTSKAIGKGKEIGVRKVMGSSKSQIVIQSFGETFLAVLLATGFGVLVAILLLPFLSLIADVPEKINFLQPIIGWFLGGMIFFMTLLSGFYPALVISRFKPVHALKNRFNQQRVGGFSIRQGLVVVQFAIAQIMMISTIIAIRQMNMVQEADLGFSKEFIYYVEVPADTQNERRIDFLKQEVLKNPGVISASLSSDVPASDNNSAYNFYFDGKSEDVAFPAFTKFADEAYFNTYGIEFLAGEPYRSSDTISQMVINETMAKRLLIENPTDAVGKEIRLGMMDNWVKISGVVRDFTPNSLRDEIKPLVIAPYKESYEVVGLKFGEHASLETISSVEESFEKIYPEHIYHGEFMDESIRQFYESEQKLALIFKIFAILSIVISCMGLYGLVSFMISQKVKEIGIRKVLGASVSQLAVMLTREYFVMVCVAFFVAVPIAYLMMEKWLETFAYKVPLSVGLFMMVLVSSLLITGVTVGSKAIRSALANPVDSLADE